MIRKNRVLFFEQTPANRLTPDALVQDVDRLIRKVYGQQDDPEGLSKTIDELSVKNAGLGNLLIEAMDLERQADTDYKYRVKKKKLELVKGGDSATVAESKAEVEFKEKLDEWNDIRKNVDLLKVKRHDTEGVINTHRSRLSLIKEDLRQT